MAPFRYRLHLFQVPSSTQENREQDPPPAPKKLKSSTLDLFIAKGKRDDAFVRDLVLAFGCSNIPLEKLKENDDGGKTLLRQFLDKYVKVDEGIVNIPTPVNLRGTHLTKLQEEGIPFLYSTLLH